jgi:hypothetical protein
LSMSVDLVCFGQELMFSNKNSASTSSTLRKCITRGSTILSCEGPYIYPVVQRPKRVVWIESS